MKKALSLNGSIALAMICSLAALQVVFGVNNALFRYAIDGIIVIILLIFSDQILLTCLFFLIYVWDKLNRLVRMIGSGVKQVIRYLASVAPSKKTPSKGVNLNPLLTAAILIVAGLLSPSDGVDSGRYLPTYQLLIRAAIILALGIGSFLVYRLLKGASKKNVNRPNAANESLPKPDEKPSTVFDVVD